MRLDLDEDLIAIRDLARQFAKDRLLPEAARNDQECHFPVEVLREGAELGFAGLFVPEHHGGTALGRLAGSLIFEELSVADPSTAAYISIHNMVAWMISEFGSEELRARFLPDLLSMEKFGSYCLTEPDHGSDAAHLRTKAERDGDSYILTGQKAFISGGGVSDIYIVMARTGGEGADGISAFIVENDRPGLSFGAQEKKMGWNSQPTAQVILDHCRIPADNLLGIEGDGFRYAMQGLDGGRLNIAACSLGGARACIERARDYTVERTQFSQKLSDMPTIRFELADMVTDLDAARLLLWRAATRYDEGAADIRVEAAKAKKFATDHASQICDRALQLHGGYGYLKDYQIERYLRDCRVHRILEGTNEIMRMLIARQVLKTVGESL